MEIRQENMIPRVPPFKVTQGHWICDGYHDFLLVIHSKLLWITNKKSWSLGLFFSAVMDVDTHTTKHEQQKCDHVYIHTPYTYFKR